MQQQKQLTQTEDWETRLIERMASKEWKDTDPVLAILTPDEIIAFVLQQRQADKQFVRRYRFKRILFGVICIAIATNLPSSFTFKNYFYFFLMLGLLLIFAEGGVLEKRFLPRYLRLERLEFLLSQTLPQCYDLTLLMTILDSHHHFLLKTRQTVSTALTRTLTLMSGDAVFLLPFELRVKLATLAEQRETPLDLSIAILLALTSARDGNIQPVLRRLSKDARSLRLREVAAECLREFSATP
jgi:hypothetical protein